MLKRSTQIRFSHKRLSINTPKDIQEKLSIDPQKDSYQMCILQDILASYLYFHILGHLTHF